MKRRESQSIEFKESWQDEYLKWVCGFANARGGVIYIGVNDDGEACGVKNCKKLMEDAFRRWDLSARSYHRILKVARTAADTEGAEQIEEKHLLEALSYRMPDKLLGE